MEMPNSRNFYIADLSENEIDMIDGGRSASDYWGGAGAAALGAGSVVRGGLIIAGAITAPGWMGAAFVVAGAAGIAYGGYQMYRALD